MWSAPYTLVNVSITGYNINDDQGTLIDTVNTTELSNMFSSIVFIICTIALESIYWIPRIVVTTGVILL